MNHSDHLDLLRDGVPAPGGVWADFGAGSGAFTMALAELLGPSGQIIAVDKDRRALRGLNSTLDARYPGVQLTIQVADFTRKLALPQLDGVVMANSLHFLPRPAQARMLRSVRGYLEPEGRLVLVEYDTDRGNAWVPHPLSYASFQPLASQAGFSRTTLLRTRPSRFLGQIYSACSLIGGMEKASKQ